MGKVTDRLKKEFRLYLDEFDRDAKFSRTPEAIAVLVIVLVLLGATGFVVIPGLGLQR